MKTEQHKYFYCNDNNCLYRIINNKYITLWLRSIGQWCLCASSKEDIYEGHYLGRYILVNESSLGYYKNKGT